jgi:hypothetical protein
MYYVSQLATIACVVLLSWPASAKDTVSTSDALPGCTVVVENRAAYNDREAFQEGLCIGTLTTVENIQINYHVFDFCIPDGVNNGQAIAVVTAWVNTHPLKADLDFAGLVAGIFEKTWPCHK